jgi:hypothetical protein
MKKTVIFLGTVVFALLSILQPAYTQPSEKPRVAVFDPTSTGGRIDEGTSVAVRELISSALVNSDKFTIVERSLLDKVMKEQKFSNSGAVDASQVSELGKLAGANKVIVSVLTEAGNRTMLSIKMIDVQTASVENQKVQTVKPDGLFDMVESLTLATIGESVPVENKDSESHSNPLSISGLFGKKKQNNASQSEETTPKEKSAKEKFAERNDTEVFFESSSDNGKEVSFEFYGVNKGNNPTAQLYLDGKPIGNGTLNQGFAVRIKDPRPGAHTLKIEWSGTVATKSFKINTAVKNYYLFEYVAGGFGYTLNIKN